MAVGESPCLVDSIRSRAPVGNRVLGVRPSCQNRTKINERSSMAEADVVSS